MDAPPRSPRELRRFGAVLAVAFPAVFCLLLPWLFSRPIPWWPLAVSGALLALAAVAPAALAPVERVWLRIGHALGFVNTRILLTLLFFLTPVLFPLTAVSIPVLRRLVRLNPATPFTLAYQEALFAGRFPPLALWLEMAAVAVVAWLVGCWIFSRLRETLVEAL